MKRYSTFLVLIAGIFLSGLTGCRKTIHIVEKPIKTMDDLIVAPAFNWETTREIGLVIGVNLPDPNTSLMSRIFIYLGNPYEGGKLLITGSAGYDYPFTVSLRVPTSALSLFSQLISPTGYSKVVEIPVSDTIHYTFTGQGREKSGLKEILDPDCNSGCNQTLSGSGTTTISNGQTYCILTSYSGTITITNGTLKICGTYSGNISMGQGNNTCNLVVTSNSVAAIDALAMSRNCTMTIYGSATATMGSAVLNQNARLINYGTATINNNFTPNDLIQNFGSFTINGQYNMNGSSSSLENSGTLTINSHWNVVNEVTNEGTIEVYGDINFNQSDVINDCKIIGHQDINFNNVDYISNNGYIHADLEATVNGGANLTLQNQSMLSCADYVMNNTVIGQGTTNVIKCTVSGRINGSQTYVSGALELLTPNGTLVNGSYPANFQNGAVLHSIANASAYIPVDSCNPEGSGQPTPTDTDGDGVPDNLDDYPLDPTRAYDNWYPSSTTYSSVVFEDLWPSRGDYDLNDAVIDYQYRVVTNAQNKLVDIKPKFYLRAAGATLKNGFGFQLDDVLPAAVQSVTGQSIEYGYISLAANGVENLQDFAVVIVWDNADNIIHRGGPSAMYNTLRNYPSGYADTVSINLHFATPQSQAVVGTPPYNPFLIKNMDRNIEIHLPDYPPTSLANVAFFGTLDDDSDPATGRYYKTATNLPWGMNIAVRYDYTYEMVPILDGYNHFADWCQSGGVQYPDWYLDLPGYRNANEIYSISK
jgi:LruC domain-containing protein